ncbi:MAG: hypothetical protein QNK37_27840 [Acidobacteriota bacterium]|nr:hypothetical protein [Acidobacteriota bacterium]
MGQVLNDFESSPIDNKLKAMLRFLEKTTLRPGDLSAEDAGRLREAGLSDAAVEDALGVTFVFNLIDRLADAFGFEVPPDEFFAKKTAPLLVKLGYQINLWRLPW